MKKAFFSPLLLCLLLATGAGCRDKFNPIDPNDPVDSLNPVSENIILNPGFNTPNTSVEDFTTSSAMPWLSAGGTPQLGAGFGPNGTTRGFIQIWGDNMSSESVMQILSQPIRKGKTYSLSAFAKLMVENSGNNNYAIIEFYAFNKPTSSSQWYDSDDATPIGSAEIINQAWQKIPFAEWTADADYTGFAIQVRSRYEGGNVSWAHIDDVELKKK